MGSYLNWDEWKLKRQIIFESKGQKPNYSFDNWLKVTKQFGDDVSSMVGQAKEKDKELDSEIKNKKKEPVEDAEESDDEVKQSAWKRLRDIAKERQEASDKKSKKTSSEDSDG